MNYFIGNLDIFPLISQSDIVNINKLISILEINNQYDVKHSMMSNTVRCQTQYDVKHSTKSNTVRCQTQYDVTSKNNNVSFEGLDKHCH